MQRLDVRRLARPGILICAALLMIGGLTADQPEAQETKAGPDTLSETYGNWTLYCGGGLQGCHVFQPIIRAKDQAKLAQVTVVPAADPKVAPTLRALLPLGATLAEGAVAEVDGADPVTVAFRSCWPRGCIAETPMTPELETRLRAGQVLGITVKADDTGRVLRFELSLEGFGLALERLRGI